MVNIGCNGCLFKIFDLLVSIKPLELFQKLKWQKEKKKGL